jgi:hypothetical protein
MNQTAFIAKTEIVALRVCSIVCLPGKFPSFIMFKELMIFQDQAIQIAFHFSIRKELLGKLISSSHHLFGELWMLVRPNNFVFQILEIVIDRNVVNIGLEAFRVPLPKAC